MHYEDMSKAKKVWYSIIAWVLLLAVTGGVWYIYYSGEGPVEEPLRKLFPQGDYIVSSTLRTLLVLLTGIFITGISETMTRLKRHLSERVMCVAISVILLLSIDLENLYCLFETGSVYRYLYTMVAVLLFIWPYLREIPYDCFGSREPWLFITAWIIPVGFVAGFGNRSLGLVVIVFAIATIIYVNKVNHRVFAWMPLGAVSAFLGAAARFMLPVYYTKDIMSPIWVYEEASSLTDGVSDLLGGVFFYFAPAILVTLAIAALLKGVHNVPLGREIVYVLTAGAVSGVLAMLIPHRGLESMYNASVFIILACAAMCLKLFEKRPAMKKYIYIGSGFFLLRLISFFVGQAL
ncbi:MAG: hypothetical protein J5626_06810 [Lachnospiraceae bacterium]|nr:hypothetical protein [Lachnospiraceae bacterium]